MFAVEIVAPFLIFTPRRIRFFGCGAIVFLQILILLTGNYTFFNFLTIALCLLLLDDFTARVDSRTEHAILENVRKNYPGITLISVTQKIASVADYDQIILLMEGEVLATGTHRELMAVSPEYVQLYDSQRSTSHYEIHA